MILKEIPLPRLKASPTNPRKRFHPVKMAELLESVRSIGIMTPLLVRPEWCVGLTDRATVQETLASMAANKVDPASWAGDYEVVAGERRLRTANDAALAGAPCIERYLCDDDALELQLIENLQREDLTLREEAAGYAAVLALKNDDGTPRFTFATLAERIGQKRQYVEARVKILCVPDEALDAVDAGLISYRYVRALSRVPTKAGREEATRLLLHPTYGLDPMSFGDFVARLHRDFFVTVKAPPFALDDAELVPVENDADGARMCGGACSDCPFLTTNDPEAAEIDGGGKPICTVPSCYHRKVDAAWDLARSAALKQGKRVLSDEEAEKLFNGGTSLDSKSLFVELAEQVPADLLRSEVKRAPSWKKLLHGIPETPQTVLVRDSGNTGRDEAVDKTYKLVKPEIVVVRDARGGIHELVDRRQAHAAHELAVKAGKASPVFRDDKKPGARVDPESDERKKKAEKAKLDLAVGFRGMAALHKAMANVSILAESKLEGAIEALGELGFYHAGADGMWWMVKRLQIEAPADRNHSGRDNEGALREHWKGLGKSEKLAMVVELLLAGAIRFNGLEDEIAAPWLDLYGVDAEAVRAEVKKEFSGKKNGGKPAATPAEEAVAADVAAAARQRMIETLPDGRIKLDVVLQAKISSSEFKVAIGGASDELLERVHEMPGLENKRRVAIAKEICARTNARVKAEEEAEVEAPAVLRTSDPYEAAASIIECEILGASMDSVSFEDSIRRAKDAHLETILKLPEFVDPARRKAVLDEIGRRVRIDGVYRGELPLEALVSSSPPPGALELTADERRAESIVLAIRAADTGEGVLMSVVAAGLGLEEIDLHKWFGTVPAKARKALGLRKSGSRIYSEVRAA